jgi:hypothetical protein
MSETTVEDVPAVFDGLDDPREPLATSGVGEKELRAEVRADLADDLGGHPRDYHADRYFTSLEESDSETLPDGGR